jgi:NitT/TauT family transport system permease protein
MPLAAEHLLRGRSRHRESATPRRPEGQALWVDGLVLAMVVAVFGGLIALGRRWSAPLERAPEIDLSLLALPRYAFFSLSRGFVAYGLSLAFTLVYGTIAANSRRAERVMIPLLDVLQSVPVLSFLPGLVIALVTLFPRSNTGLELACVLAIFTGQVWNMTFSYFASLRAIPKELIEVSRVCRIGRWRRFTMLELPSAMIGLVWNSMMSMAGGWFFITVIESFKLRNEAFRLPGIGSYMNAAIEGHDVGAMVGACAAMVLVIVLVDQLLWRPVIAWSQRFKMEETEAAELPTSFVYDILRRSRLPAWLARCTQGIRWPGRRRAPDVQAGGGTIGVLEQRPGRAIALRLAGGASAILFAGLLLLGGWHLLLLLAEVPAGEWLGIGSALGLTALRVSGVLFLGGLWTVPVGIAIGSSPRLSRVLQPVIQVIASFPVPMLYPLIAPALVGLGLPFGVVSIALMLFGTQWYVLFNVVAGAIAVPHDLREVAAVCRLPSIRRVGRLYLPGIFPYLLTGLITAAGGAWNASIVAEWVPVGEGQVLTARGIGASISRAFDTSDDGHLAASVLVLCVALVLLNRFVWKPLYRLADERFALNR